jgi:teichuronic acid exporter
VRDPRLSLGASVASALRWSAGGRLATQVLSWVSTLVVIRLLHPEDYGLMAMATAATSLSVLLNEMGLTTVIVQRRDLTDEDLRALLGATVLMNMTMFAVFFLMAPLIAAYFHSPDVAPVLRVLALGFPIQSFGLIHAAILLREMDFKTRAMVESGAKLIGSITSLALASLGSGVWALVIGTLVAVTGRSAGFSLLSSKRYRPSFRVSRALPLLRFGGVILLQRLGTWSYQQVDMLIIGRLLPTEAVGVYAIARYLARLPIIKMGSMLNQIGLSAFARVQNDDSRVRHYVIQAIRMLGLVGFPVFFGISALAPEAVPVILGERWISAVEPIRILTLVVPLQMINTQVSEVLNARGHPGMLLGNTIILTCAIAPAVLLGSWWGVLGVSCGWAAGYGAAFPLITRRAQPFTGVGPSETARLLARPAIAGAIMYMAVEVSRHLLAGVQIPPLLSLVLLTAIGALVYLLMIVLFDRELLRDLWIFARA